MILVTHNIDEAVMLCDRIAVMSARPGLIKSIVTVDVPRPRTMKSMKDPDFSNCMDKIWNFSNTMSRMRWNAAGRDGNCNRRAR